MLGCARDKDHAPQEFRLPPLQLLVEADPVEFRHAEIAEDEVVGSILDFLEGTLTVHGHVDLIPFGGQGVGQRLSYEGLVADHENMNRSFHRSVGSPHSELLQANGAPSRPTIN